MKNCILFYLVFAACFFSVVNTYSQDYYPLPFDGGVWQEDYSYAAPNFVSSELTLYYFEGDTIIGGNLYKKVYKEGNYTTMSSVGTISEDFPKTYFGGMRQDSIAKKVYYFGPDSSAEQLLYDFDLSVGDTLKFLCPGTLPNPLCSTVILVDSIGEILIDDSLRHEYFYHVDVPYLQTGAIIESIGNTHGFIYSNLQGSSGNVFRDITCVTFNGIKVYGDAPVCFSPGDFTAVTTLADQTISVNEFQNGNEIIFRLSNPNNKMIRLTITDMLGQVEGSFQFNHSQDLSVSRSAFSPGCHLATFTSDDGSRGSIKFVIF